MEPVSGAGAGELCAGHAMRSDVATSAGHYACASVRGQVANLGDVISDSLINAHSFPTAFSLCLFPSPF